jgi:hypothetical protein
MYGEDIDVTTRKVKKSDTLVFEIKTNNMQANLLSQPAGLSLQHIKSHFIIITLHFIVN